MLRTLRTRWLQGLHTTAWPGEAAAFPERFRGRPVLDPSRCGDCKGCRERAPSNLLQVGADGRPALDVGACRFAPEEAEACPNGAVTFTGDPRMASATREGLRTATGEVELARALERSTRAVLGRSLRLRSVSAGGCNGCEAELVALGNVVFDMARFGIQFVASPRHADGIVITGPVSANMRSAVYDTLAATPEPRLVIAAGACAIDGGPFRGSPEVGDGAPNDLHVDLWIPGCPPHPITILDGLLRLMGRIRDGAVTPSTGP